VKAGIVGLTRAAALDLADFGITVNAISPGPIKTDLLTRVWTADALRERAQHAPIARLGSVEEIAHGATPRDAVRDAARAISRELGAMSWPPARSTG